LQIVAKRGIGGLFYTPALLSSPFLDEIASINFVIDTGATMTTISDFDALNNQIKCTTFESAIETIGAGSSLPTRVIRNCKIAFTSSVDSFVEHLDNVNVLCSFDSKSTVFTFISVIGLDLLVNYAIQCKDDSTMILEKV